MRARRTGRFVALLALVAVIVATALVVRAGVKTTHHLAPKGPTVAASPRRVPKKRFYVIRPGDTLSTISVKTGVPVAQLEALNHSLAADPNALQTGQTLRLR
ncbi:MAG TPA: LysM domain-containing protein [Solirubrobacteraceae bacterium]|nr:LysM domain-containing protein [Solirubrobacteraceae bacterium]